MATIEIKITYERDGVMMTLAHARVPSGGDPVVYEVQEDQVFKREDREIVVARAGLKVMYIKVPWYKRLWRWIFSRN